MLLLSVCSNTFQKSQNMVSYLHHNHRYRENWNCETMLKYLVQDQYKRFLSTPLQIFYNLNLICFHSQYISLYHSLSLSLFASICCFSCEFSNHWLTHYSLSINAWRSSEFGSIATEHVYFIWPNENCLFAGAAFLHLHGFIRSNLLPSSPLSHHWSHWSRRDTWWGRRR